mmetsp:Transcript_15198/g.43281  ORF Transcript_15198/g.43281 Transcript_15198/m.43281 type:complete len:297 (+) Transcript_15198:1541-2431(+)
MSLTPSSSLTIVMARSGLNEGTSFWSVASSLMTSGGSTSTRVDNSCPNLMKVGPNLNNASRKSAASFDRAATASGPCASLNLRRFRATRNANPTAVRQMAVVRAAALNLLNRLRDVIVGTVARAPAAADTASVSSSTPSISMLKSKAFAASSSTRYCKGASGARPSLTPSSISRIAASVSLSFKSTSAAVSRAPSRVARLPRSRTRVAQSPDTSSIPMAPSRSRTAPSARAAASSNVSDRFAPRSKGGRFSSFSRTAGVAGRFVVPRGLKDRAAAVVSRVRLHTLRMAAVASCYLF